MDMLQNNYLITYTSYEILKTTLISHLLFRLLKHVAVMQRYESFIPFYFPCPIISNKCYHSAITLHFLYHKLGYHSHIVVDCSNMCNHLGRLTNFIRTCIRKAYVLSVIWTSCVR